MNTEASNGDFIKGWDESASSWSVTYLNESGMHSFALCINDTVPIEDILTIAHTYISATQGEDDYYIKGVEFTEWLITPVFSGG